MQVAHTRALSLSSACWTQRGCSTDVGGRGFCRTRPGPPLATGGVVPVPMAVPFTSCLPRTSGSALHPPKPVALKPARAHALRRLHSPHIAARTPAPVESTQGTRQGAHQPPKPPVPDHKREIRTGRLLCGLPRPAAGSTAKHPARPFS